jgi:outer membrane protein
MTVTAIRSITIGLLLGVMPVVAEAQSVDMKSLASTVVASSPRIDAQRAAVAVLEARLRGARAGYYPSVQANALSERRDLSIHGATGGQQFNVGQADIEARLPLFDGFRTPNAVKIAEAELAAGKAVLEGTVQDVLLQLLTATADVHRDRQIQAFAQQQYASISDQLSATGRLLKFGEATRTDQNQAKARLAVSQTSILAADEEFGVSAALFEAVSGQPADAVPELPSLPALPPSVEEAEASLAQNPAVISAQNTAAAAERGINYARGALAPQVDVVAGYEYLRGGVANLFTGSLPNDRSAVYAGVELRVPIFQQGKEYAEIARAKALSSQRIAQVGQVQRDVRQDLQTSWARWRSASATIVAAQAAVTANMDAADGVRKEAIGGGSRTVLDVLNAQNELLQARAALQRAVRNEYVARVAILATIGRLDPAAFAPPVPK